MKTHTKRPRRFGKSLFIDTLKEAFEGNKNLFSNLWLHDHWDWEKHYPVIHISFGGGVIRSREELDQRIRDIRNTNHFRGSDKPKNYHTKHEPGNIS
ncbi:MAG: AAA family ATPase [Thermodesulfobacteriota bacterium]